MIELMEHESYKRLRQVMENLGINLTDAELARKLNLLDQHITHWKKRGVPKDALINLADEWGFRIKFVMNGEGAMFDKYRPYQNSAESAALKVMQEMDEQTKYQFVRIGHTLIEPSKGEKNGTK